MFDLIFYGLYLSEIAWRMEVAMKLILCQPSELNAFVVGPLEGEMGPGGVMYWSGFWSRKD